MRRVMRKAGSRDVETVAAVLLVEDERALLKALGRHLRAAGYQVTACENGAIAAEKIGTQPFDVVLSDIDMPGLGGLDLLKLIRERGVDVPVVLMTGAPTLETAMTAVEHGAFKYLRKPVQIEELLETLLRARRSRGRRSRSSQRAVDPLASPPAVSATMAPGTVVAGRYRLVRLLGEGGMGQVWEAIQQSTARPVAIKLLHTNLATKTRSLMGKRMLREARAASAVEHPNVVDVFDLFELPDGTPVLVMALLRGQTLGRHLTEAKSLTLREAADLLLPVVSAVGTAHANGVVHRDLKPDNIFLAKEAGRTTVKVLDFGIAKLMSTEVPEGRTLTAVGVPVGTPGYIAPEQAMGERDIDHRADVWSLGAILYEALSGARPVRADSIGQVIKLLFTSTIPSIAEVVPGLHASVAGLVDRMLARDRDQRPADLREVHAELARHARVEAPSFGPPARRKAAPVSDSSPSATALAHARTELGDALPTLPPARRARSSKPPAR